jgi:hypothetical protein
MSMFRKKPLVIEAVQFLGVTEAKLVELSDDQLSPEFRAQFNEATFPEHTPDGGKLTIFTQDGEEHTALPGDWLVLKPSGIYPYWPDIFEAKYEAPLPI